MSAVKTRPPWTRREILWSLPSTLAFAPARAANAQDAWTLLRKTEGIYAAATSYDVSAYGTSKYVGLRLLTTRSWLSRMAALAPDHFFSETSSSPPPRNSGAAAGDTIICGDGQSVYLFSPKLNEYTEEVYRQEPGSPPRDTHGSRMFARAHEEHFERFRSVASRPQREPRLRRHRTIKVFGREVICHQIDTHSIRNSGEHWWSEKLWLDPGNHRVVRSLRGRLHITGDRQARIFRWCETQYLWHVFGGEIPLETFRFVPPPGAKLVERLGQSTPGAGQ